jgi:hypothetical protein
MREKLSMVTAPRSQREVRGFDSRLPLQEGQRMKRNAKGFRELVRLAMKYQVKTDYNTSIATCLCCGKEFQLRPDEVDLWVVEGHMEDHIVDERITAQNVMERII